MTMESIELNANLNYHLVHNHVPSVPSVWVEVCQWIVESAPTEEEELDEFLELEVDNPVKEGGSMTVRQVIDGLHLWGFLPQ